MNIIGSYAIGLLFNFVEVGVVGVPLRVTVVCYYKPLFQKIYLMILNNAWYAVHAFEALIVFDFIIKPF